MGNKQGNVMFKWETKREENGNVDFTYSDEVTVIIVVMILWMWNAKEFKIKYGNRFKDEFRRF